MTITLAIVSDVHHSTIDQNVLCTQALPLLGYFARWCNDRAPDRVVNLGDNISEISSAVDPALASQLAAVYAQFVPVVQHLPGNHDLQNLTIPNWETIFGKSFSARSEDVNGFHLVYFCPVRSDGPYTYTSGELAWLASDLAATALPTILFTHVPIRASSLDGNKYFVPNGNGEWTNGDAVHEILKASKAVLCVSGHTHWNAWHVEDDIVYITVPSLVEARRTPPNASGATALVTVDDKKIVLKVRGRDSVSYRMRRRIGAAVWV